VVYIEYFPYCLFVSNSQVKTASEMTYTVSGGALNSTQSNQSNAHAERADTYEEFLLFMAYTCCVIWHKYECCSYFIVVIIPAYAHYFFKSILYANYV